MTHVLAALSAVNLCQYYLNESDFAAQAPGSGQKRDQRDICTCSSALGGAQRDPNGWMDRSSNAPRVSNGLAAVFCNAPLSDGAKVYLRSVTRLNPACYTLLLSNGIWLPPCSGVWSPREVGVRQCEHASPSLVTPRVTMSALDTGSTPQCSRVQYTWSCVSCRHTYICTGWLKAKP